MDTTTSSHTRSRSKSTILSNSSPSPGRQRYIDYVIGIVLLLIVVFLWTSSSFITQALFEGGYEKAFLVTYLNTSTFTLYIIPHLVKRGIRHHNHQALGGINRRRISILLTLFSDSLEPRWGI
ncbi:hypothetical protein L218DRAFT_27836 [Marasmius fiardii PR-910]|nr:hypothetical protein L218DRAFT_27836 [Marasmius fiardii PR-910]